MKLPVILILSLSISTSVGLQFSILDVKILHDISTPKDMRFEPWPVLFLELDVGNVCFTTKDPNIANFDRDYFPECNQLLCIGLVGPISVWTRDGLFDALGNCVLNAIFSKNELYLEELPDEFMEISVPTPLPIPLKVDFFPEPDSNFENVLTDPKILNFQIAKRSTFFKSLRVVVDSFAGEDLSFCLFRQEEIISILAGPLGEKYFKNCDFTCPVFKKHFFNFEDSKIVKEILPCLGTLLTHMERFPSSLGFERDVKTGKIHILVNNKPRQFSDITAQYMQIVSENSGVASDYRDEF